MLCFVYKSPKKDQTYLFILKRDDFSTIPESLLANFGVPQLVMPLEISPQLPLAGADSARVIEQLESQGFYLQLPPPSVDHLKQFKLANQSHSQI